MDGARARESNRVAFVLPLSGRSVVIQLSEYYKYHEQWRHGARFELVFFTLHAPSSRVAVEKDDGENELLGCWCVLCSQTRDFNKAVMNKYPRFLSPIMMHKTILWLNFFF